jgi:hypothetical protein
MKRLSWVATALSVLLLGACGGNPVTVDVALGGADDAERRPVPRLEVRLLPFDRDAVFDSLEAGHPTPAPQVPDTLLQLQARIAQANEEWQSAERQWIAVRDSLRTISETLQGMSRAQPQYVVLFRDFQQLEPQERALQRRSQEAFSRFSQLQASYAAQSDEIRLQRQQWGDEAFADVDRIFAQRIRELGREPMVDTTDASGRVTFRPAAGAWWVYSRVEAPYAEYYWNVPVRVQRGEPVEVRLDATNAEIRPGL